MIVSIPNQHTSRTERIKMKKMYISTQLALLFLIGMITTNQAISQDGFKPLFDGKSLDGWEGDQNLWRVVDGAIVGETTAEKPISTNQFLVWKHGELDDFVLRFKFRITGSKANSGVQVRSQMTDQGGLRGYQADIDRSGQFIGIVYSEATGRGILGGRGLRTTYGDDNLKKEELIGDPTELIKGINFDDWIDYEIRASGSHLTTKINQTVMTEVIDNDHQQSVRQGLLGLQLHAGPPMKIEFKDIQLKRLALADNLKKIVFVAGDASHGRGLHEHNAGCRLLAGRLNEVAHKGIIGSMTTVYQNGWPADPTAFDNADCIVSYCDGGEGHYLHQNRDEFKRVMDRGVGLVLLHYAVEVPQGETGDKFLEWAGGYFEKHWSVNPIWEADFTTIPEHPITRGVKPFKLLDEWYYHMRFAPNMIGVTPILSALPPQESLSRPDGPHSGNPHVRKAVLDDKAPQHVAWAFEGKGGQARGFGFTGGHWHKNWKHEEYRKLILNAIVWTAKLEVPAEGVQSSTPTDTEMEENLDE
jgi:type 1 glutamine amidotransferase